MNNIDENLISTIIYILLIIMISLLIILSVTFLILRAKQNNNKEDNKKRKATKTKKGNESNKSIADVGGYSKSSIFDFMEFDEIEDNMIIQKNGKRFLMVVECQGVNYDLMSQMEKVSVEEGFQQFLNTLRHPIQLYIQTRTINLENSINTYKQKVEEIENKYNNMKYHYQTMKNSGAYTKEQLEAYFYEMTKQKNLLDYGKDIVYNTEKVSLNKNVLNKRYYIVIPYFPEEANDEKYAKEEVKSIAFSELYTRAQAIVRTISACSVTGRILTSNELAELLYVAYNRDESETFGVDKAVKAGYNELYSTSKDVFEKKIRILDNEIEQRAIKKANESVEKAKSIIQENAEQKEKSMESLINKLAQIVIEENSNYVGKDVANVAIEQIKNEEGGNRNVDKKKSAKGRKKRTQ